MRSSGTGPLSFGQCDNEMDPLNLNFPLLAMAVQRADPQQSSRKTSNTCSIAERRNLKAGSSATILINVAHTKYPVVAASARSLGWKTSKKPAYRGDSIWDIAWVDAGLGVEKTIRELRPHQRVNHFPGMVEIYRKDKLGRNMDRMRALCPSEYSFTPQTWYLPQDRDAVCAYLRTAERRSAVIVKPAGGAQGRGIFLAMHPNQIPASSSSSSSPSPPPTVTSSIVQTYLPRPYLIDGFKFDLRIYALVSSCDPLRMYIYKEGLCRFCTSPYVPPRSDNLNNAFMHLTNYSINKHHTAFVPAQGNGSEDNNLGKETLHEKGASKRSLSWLRKYLEAKGQASEDVDDSSGSGVDAFSQLFSRISDILVKTVLSCLPRLQQQFHANKLSSGLNRNPFSCFELLGFDIFLSADLQPYLLEVNHMPSFSTDSELDLNIKTKLITDTLSMLNISAKDRRSEVRASSLRSQGRLYGPCEDHQTDRRCNSFAASHRRESATSSPNPSASDASTPYWASYLANEVKQLQQHDGFELIYPANARPNQVTAGRAPMYAYLLYLAEVAAAWPAGRPPSRGVEVLSFERFRLQAGLLSTSAVRMEGVPFASTALGQTRLTTSRQAAQTTQGAERPTRWKQRTAASSSCAVPSGGLFPSEEQKRGGHDQGGGESLRDETTPPSDVRVQAETGAGYAPWYAWQPPNQERQPVQSSLRHRLGLTLGLGYDDVHRDDAAAPTSWSGSWDPYVRGEAHTEAKVVTEIFEQHYRPPGGDEQVGGDYWRASQDLSQDEMGGSEWAVGSVGLPTVWQLDKEDEETATSVPAAMWSNFEVSDQKTAIAPVCDEEDFVASIGEQYERYKQEYLARYRLAKSQLQA